MENALQKPCYAPKDLRKWKVSRLNHQLVPITLLASNKWNLIAMDIKTTFLPGKKIDRTFIIKTPKEAQANAYTA